jgi:hypothetical protein
MKTENTATRAAQTGNGGENAGKSGAKPLSESRQNVVNSRNVTCNLKKRASTINLYFCKSNCLKQIRKWQKRINQKD